SSVGRYPARERSNSAWPTPCSMRRSERNTVEASTPRRSPAAASVPPRTIARATSRSDALIRYCVRAFIDCHPAYFPGTDAILQSARLHPSSTRNRSMKLYYASGACSLAVHIALREVGADFELVAVDLARRTLADGTPFQAISPRGYVPV